MVNRLASLRRCSSDSGGRVLLLPQLGGDGLHLLPQVIIPLVLVHLLLDPVVDLLLQGEDLVLALHRLGQQLQPLEGAGLLQNLLLGFHVQHDVAGHVFRYVDGIVVDQHIGNDLLGHLGGEVTVFFKQLLHRPHQGVVHHRPDHPWPLKGHFLRQHLKVRVPGEDVHQPSPVQTVDQHPQGIILGFNDLADLRHHTYLIQIVGRRVVVTNVFLGHQEDPAVLGHHGIQREDRLFPPHIKVKDHIGEKHQTTKGKHGNFYRETLLVHRCITHHLTSFTSHEKFLSPWGTG